MENKVVYEKVYFGNEYRQEVEAFRSHYRMRMQEALQGRSIDHTPVPNATTVVHLHDDPDGGVTITTGDFVDFFNQKYGGSDRIGAVRKSLELAKIKAENCKEEQPARREAMQRSAEKGFFGSVRTVKRHFAFCHAFFALLLALSMALLICSSVVLERENERVLALEKEVAVLESNAVPKEQEPTSVTILGYNMESIASLSMDGENHVEFYETEAYGGIEMSALLNALLGGK